MKINTKKCLPIPDAPEEAIIHPNKYILDHYHDDSPHLHSEFFHGKDSPVIKTEKTVIVVTPDDCASSSTTTITTTNNNSNNKKADNGGFVVGRQVKYLPTLVYTPVQTSSRRSSSTTPSKNERHLLTKDEMDDLNKRLADLFVGTTNDEEEEEEKKEETTTTTTVDETLGRYVATTFNYKTCKTANVFRSARVSPK
jgi:hypothetical protein